MSAGAGSSGAIEAELRRIEEAAAGSPARETIAASIGRIRQLLGGETDSAGAPTDDAPAMEAPDDLQGPPS